MAQRRRAGFGVYSGYMSIRREKGLLLSIIIKVGRRIAGLWRFLRLCLPPPEGWRRSFYAHGGGGRVHGASRFVE